MKRTVSLILTLLVLTVCAGLFLLIKPQGKKGNPFPEQLKPGGIGSALVDWTATRAYPDKALDPRKFGEAFQNWKEEQSSLKTAMAGEWEDIGPKNFGGRTLCISFNPLNPNTIYAGTAGGGLWRSHTGGAGPQAWEAIETGFPVIGVPAVAVHPQDSNILFIGTGEVYNYQNAGTGFAVWRTRGTYGIGILKSTDGGNSWTQSLSWPSNNLHGVNMIKFNPQNPNTLFAATTEGVYRSHNLGASWDQVFQGIFVSDLLVHSADTSNVMIAVGNLLSMGRGLYRSVNAGGSWVPVTGLPDFLGKVMLGQMAGNPESVVASIGYSNGPSELYRSTNFGLSWSPFGQAFFTYGWYAHDVAVHPTNPNEVICGGVNTFAYEPAGDTLSVRAYWWKWDLAATPVGGPEGPPDYVHADIHDIQYHPSDPGKIYFATDGGVFRSLDGGISFEGVNGGLQTVQFYPGCANSVQDSLFFIGGLQDNATTIYEGNPAWRRVIGGDGGYCAISRLDDSRVYGSYIWLSLYRSLDRAQFFENLENYLPQRDYTSANFIAPFALCDLNDQILYAGGDTIFRTTDGGNSWVHAGGMFDNGRNALSIAISPLNCNKVYASSSPITQGSLGEVIHEPPAGVLRSTNSGNTWQHIDASLPDRLCMDFAIHPADDDFVYIALGGYGSSHIFRTTNGGQSWQDRGAGLPDVPFNTLILDPSQPQHVYAGCDLGVFFSSDGGQNWTDFNEGLTDATLVMDLSISSANRKLRIGTHGKGVYQRALVYQPATGISAEPDDSAISISPNPSSGLFNIHIRQISAGEVSATLFTTDGKRLQELIPPLNLSPGEYNFEGKMEGLAAGIYLLRIRSGDRIISRRMVHFR